jgi:CubicO group peptidase (beta-lactamase class C family)
MTFSLATVEDGQVIRNVDGDADVPWWSFTKFLIAATALALVRDGVLRLDDLLPGRRYSLRQLLQHRAGLPDYGALQSYNEAVSRDDDAWPVDTMLRRVGADRLRFEPGQGWAYSNIGYLVARQHLEASCGVGIDDIMRRWLFAPLGITAPRVVRTRSDIRGLSALPSYDPAWVYHGVVVGPLKDAALLLDRLMTSDLLPAHMIAEMCDGLAIEGAASDRPWVTTAYGLGVMSGTDRHGSHVIGHSGAGPGSVIAVYHHVHAHPATTRAVFSPGEDVGMVEAVAFAAAGRD